MKLTVTELGPLFLILFGVFHYLKIFTKIRAVLAFLGVVVIGTSGFLGRMFHDAGTWAQHAFGSVTSWAIGVSFTAGLFVIIAILVVHALHPKNGAKPHTGWLAIALAVLVVAGVAGIPALAGLQHGIVSALSSAVATINSA